MKVCLAVCVLLMAAAAQAGEIHGKVVSVNRAEPLRQVQVMVLELKRSATTGDDGSFSLGDIPPGSYTLRVAAVGYRLVTTPFTIESAEDAKEFSITLAPDNFRRTEVVEVKGDIFQGETPAAPSHITLTATELKEASTVLANDPFRAVQALPGVSAADNNDFFGQFSVAGAPFERVAVYVDDVLVPEPFHSIPGFSEGASLSVFSSETVQSLDLMPVAFPERFADATGAALAVRTREGSRTRPHFTVSAGMADTDLIGEGGLGHSGKGSWLASARKSYLDYLIHRPAGDPFTNVSFEDADLKLSYDVAPRQNVNFYFLDGHTDVSRHDPLNGLNDLDTGSNDFTLGRVGWRYAVTPQLLLDSDAAYIRQRFHTTNLNSQVLNADYYGEWVLASRTTWSWGKAHILEAGYSGRRLRDTFYSFFFAAEGPEFFQRTDGTAFRQSSYVQQASNFLGNRLHLMAGLRWDALQRIETLPVSAQVSLAWQAASATTLNLGYGRYAQFNVDAAVRPCIPVPTNLAPGVFPADDLVGRSNHFVAGVEQRFGENLRVRLEGFVRENREIVGERTFDANGCSFVRPARIFPGSSFRDYARGGQFIIQRRSANRLSGWLGYTLNYARQRLPVFINGLSTIVSAPTEGDQRHTLNAFATYRLRPTINLSGKFRYGSGTPITALDFQVIGNNVVAASPAKERLGAYQRLDFRCDKAWPFRRWKMTLYGEMLNITNHDNPRFITVSFNPITNQATAVTERGLPITPTAGLTFEF
jgi:carboxypeptidase-like protein